jgi:Tfp pilus assembly protein PilF
VSLSFKVDSLIVRLIQLAIGVAICFLLFRVAYSNFIVRVITDPRLEFTREALSVVATSEPNSPRILFRLAQAETAGEVITNFQGVESAIGHARRASELTFWDYRYKQLLAHLQELNGDPDSAEQSLRVAVKLAPNNSEVNWLYANLLIRLGRLDESLAPLKSASMMNERYYPQAYDLLWQASGQNLELLKTMAGDDATARLALVQFMLDQSLTSEALALFRGIDRQIKIDSGKGASFIRSLIASGRIESARSLWLELLGSNAQAQSSTDSPANQVWNSGFEADSIRNFDHFDWTITPSEYARIGIDSRANHSGSRSLKISFAGRDTTTLRGEAKQLVFLRPGVRYRIECFVKTSDLFTPEGPKIAIIGPSGVLAASDPIPEGTNDWKLVSFEYIAPNETSPKYLTIVRIPKFSYDDQTRGVVWFDDFSIIELPRQ